MGFSKYAARSNTLYEHVYEIMIVYDYNKFTESKSDVLRLLPLQIVDKKHFLDIKKILLVYDPKEITILILKTWVYDPIFVLGFVVFVDYSPYYNRY